MLMLIMSLCIAVQVILDTLDATFDMYCTEHTFLTHLYESVYIHT